VQKRLQNDTFYANKEVISRSPPAGRERTRTGQWFRETLINQAGRLVFFQGIDLPKE